jgi:hypothetical protein
MCEFLYYAKYRMEGIVRLFILLTVIAALPALANAQPPRRWLGIGAAAIHRDIADYLPGARRIGFGGQAVFEIHSDRTNDALVAKLSLSEFEHRSDAIPGLNRSIARGPRLTRAVAADWQPDHAGNTSAMIMSGEIGWRWYSRSMAEGLFAQIGVGAARLSSGNQQTTRASGSVGAGYAIQLGQGVRALTEARFEWIGQENIVERGASPRWLVPLVVGLSWAL